MKFQLEIDFSNPAFDELPDLELAKILVGIAEQLARGTATACSPLYASNGNHVGAYQTVQTEQRAAYR